MIQNSNVFDKKTIKLLSSMISITKRLKLSINVKKNVNKTYQDVENDHFARIHEKTISSCLNLLENYNSVLKLEKSKHFFS